MILLFMMYCFFADEEINNLDNTDNKLNNIIVSHEDKIKDKDSVNANENNPIATKKDVSEQDLAKPESTDTTKELNLNDEIIKNEQKDDETSMQTTELNLDNNEIENSNTTEKVKNKKQNKSIIQSMLNIIKLVTKTKVISSLHQEIIILILFFSILLVIALLFELFKLAVFLLFIFFSIMLSFIINYMLFIMFTIDCICKELDICTE